MAARKTNRVLTLLEKYESPNVTFIEPDRSWPIVWERARGNYVWDAEGRRYLDMTAAFGVAAAGHANSAVVRAGQRQMAKLLHAMGDVHPHALKAELAQTLSQITFERWSEKSKTRGKTIFGNSGFEAVEAALKTAALASGRRDIIAFTGAYHGLGYGALNATHRDHFRSRFLTQIGGFGHFVDFPSSERQLSETRDRLAEICRSHPIGGILAEPIQARGGIRIPPLNFLPLLREIATEHNALLIFDEIYTGFGRTGKWFACDWSHTVPDLICLGKALTGGFPLSACVGRAELMDSAWPKSTGEAIHTSTYLGHPVGCAMALAQIKELKSKKLIERSAKLGKVLLDGLSSIPSGPESALEARGMGLMAGLELRDSSGAPATQLSLAVVKELLGKGFLILPEGAEANVLGFTPPLTVTLRQIRQTVETLRGILAKPPQLTLRK